jgi:hypothetical protein
MIKLIYKYEIVSQNVNIVVAGLVRNTTTRVNFIDCIYSVQKITKVRIKKLTNFTCSYNIKKS